MAARVYNGHWPRLRPKILARDRYLCRIGLPGCTVTAAAVDHIVPVALGGAWWDPENLRAACTSCNTKRAQDSRNAATRARWARAAGLNPSAPSRDW